MLLGLVPERSRVRVKSVKQTGQGIRGSTARLVRLDTSGFGAREDQRRGNQESDVVEVSDFGLVHFTTIPHNQSTA
jgi:hypothetical protein